MATATGCLLVPTLESSSQPACRSRQAGSGVGQAERALRLQDGGHGNGAGDCRPSSICIGSERDASAVAAGLQPQKLQAMSHCFFFAWALWVFSGISLLWLRAAISLARCIFQSSATLALRSDNASAFFQVPSKSAVSQPLLPRSSSLSSRLLPPAISRLVEKPGSTKQEVPPAAMYPHPPPHVACAGINIRQQSKFGTWRAFRNCVPLPPIFTLAAPAPAAGGGGPPPRKMWHPSTFLYSRLHNDATPKHVSGGS